MVHLIDKGALVAEIKRRKQVAFGWMETAPNDAIEAEFELCDDILSFIDTLEVKEVDLDYIQKELDELIKIHKPNKDFGWGTLYNVATHFFELGLKAKTMEE